MENSIVTVKTNREDLFNVECLWPGVGDIALSECGEAKVEREGAEILIQGHPHFFIIEDGGFEGEGVKSLESITIKAHVDELNSQEAGEAIDTGVPDGDAIDAAAYKATFEVKTKKELEDLCKPFPSSEWRGKNKNDLIAYLIEKLN